MNLRKEKQNHRSPLGVFQGIVLTFCQRLKLLQSPGTAQEYSDDPARQPSPLRSDRCAAMGLTRLLSIALTNFLTFDSKLKICLVFRSSSYIFCQAVLRWREQACSANHALNEVESMLAERILHIYQEVKGIQDTLDNVKKSAPKKGELTGIKEKKAWLEKQFRDDSKAATVSDEITRLQRLADEIREFSKDKKIYQLKQVIEIALDEAYKFQEEFFQPVSNDVLTALELGVKTFKNSFNLILNAAKSLKSIDELNGNSSGLKLHNWARNLEILGEEIEGSLPLIESSLLDALEELCETIVLKTRVKGENAKNKRESYRRRLRFAAGFILNLVETAREDALEEDKEMLRDAQILSQETLSAIYCEDDRLWNLENLNQGN